MKRDRKKGGQELYKLETELKSRGFSHMTVKNYCFFTEKFLIFCNKNSEDLKEDDAKSYLSSLFEDKSKNTIMLAAASLKFFYSHILNKNIGNIKLPKKNKKFPEVLSKQEIKKIIKLAETEKSRLIVSLLYSSGLRVSEIVNLKPSDINFQENNGRIRKSKENKGRFFIFSQILSEEIKNYLDRQSENNYLFSKEKPLTTRNIQKIVKKLGQKAEIHKKITPHTLRHSFATHLLEQGTDKRLIQTILGRENLQTTQIYARVSNEQLKKIKNPLDNLSEEQG